jgi:hypothetical protein
MQNFISSASAAPQFGQARGDLILTVAGAGSSEEPQLTQVFHPICVSAPHRLQRISFSPAAAVSFKLCPQARQNRLPSGSFILHCGHSIMLDPFMLLPGKLKSGCRRESLVAEKNAISI